MLNHFKKITFLELWPRSRTISFNNRTFFYSVSIWFHFWRKIFSTFLLDAVNLCDDGGNRNKNPLTGKVSRSCMLGSVKKAAIHSWRTWQHFNLVCRDDIDVTFERQLLLICLAIWNLQKHFFDEGIERIIKRMDTEQTICMFSVCFGIWSVSEIKCYKSDNL